MLVSRRMLHIVLEASEASGIAPAELLAPLGPGAAELARPGPKIDWSTLVAVTERLGAVVGQDVEALRSVGRRTSRTSVNGVLRRFAGVVVSPRDLYELGVKWLGPADFAHLPLSLERLSEERLRIRAEIPAAYAPSAAFLRITEGMLMELPRLCGLPAASLVESRISSRELDIVLELPRPTSRVQKLRRTIGVALRARETIALLEEQRAALAEGIQALRRAQDESRALLERLPDMVVVHAAGTILWANRAALRTLGYERLEELVGTKLLDIVAPDSRGFVEKRMREPPDTPSWPELTEVWLLDRHDSSVVVEVARTQSVVFDGAPARLIVGRDVTERLRMQQRLVTADRLASVGQLAAGVAHEVNNPLAYVRG